MVRMLSVGTATQDVFMSSDDLQPLHRQNGEMYEEIKLGAKLTLSRLVFATGGNAMNAAVTFARQGLDSAFMGYIGDDPAGQAVQQDLDKENVDASRVTVAPNQLTSYSAVMLASNGERTIFNYAGVKIGEAGREIDVSKIDGDWLYISSLGGPIESLNTVVTAAAKKGMKIAFNPGSRELKYPDKIRALLDDITIFILNKEEMQLIVEGSSSEELAMHAAHFVDIAVVTDGPNGVVAVGQNKIVSAGMYEDVPVVDRLGAGDAFGSGLTAAIAQGKSLEDAIILASANSTSVVGQIGAKAGILHADAELHTMPIKITPLT